MKTLLLSLLVCSSLLADLIDDITGSIEGDVKATYISYQDKPTKNTYYINQNNPSFEFSLWGIYHWKDLDFNIKISNRLSDTYIEKASIKYHGRTGRHMYTTEVGTIDTYRGIFDTTASSRDQSPMIFKNSGVYNDEFLQGFLETTIGFEQSYSYILIDKYILTGRYIAARIRELDKTKAEQSIFGYESDYADLTYEDLVYSGSLEFNYSDKLYLFYTNSHVKFGLEATHGLSAEQTLNEYGITGDSSLFSYLITSPYDMRVNRVGGSFRNSNFIYAYERFHMHLSNESAMSKLNAEGYYHYLAHYATDEFTPYLSYGASTNDRPNSKKYDEYIIGARYTFDENWLFMTEYRDTNWIQHDTNQQHQDYLEVSDKKRDAQMMILQVIYSF